MKKIAALVVVCLLVSAGAGMYALRGMLNDFEQQWTDGLKKQGWTIAFNEKAELRPLSVQYRNITVENLENKGMATIGTLRLKPDAMSFLRGKFFVKKVVLSDVTFSFKNVKVDFPVVKLLMPKDGRINLSGRLGAYDDFFAFDGDFDGTKFDLTVKSGNLFAALSGNTTENGMESTLKISATQTPVRGAPDLAVAAKITTAGEQVEIPSFTVNLGGRGRTLLKADGRFADKTLSADVSGTTDSIVSVPLTYAGKIKASQNETAVEKMTLSAGDSRAVFSFFKSSDTLNLDVKAGVVDLSQLLPVLDIPALPFHTAGQSVPFADKKGKIAVSIEKLIGANGKNVGQAVFLANLKNGVLDIPDFKIASFLTAAAKLDASDAAAANASLDMRMNAFPVAVIGFKNGLESGTVGGAVRLKARAASIDGLRRGLNGKIALTAKNVFVNAGQRRQKLPAVLEIADNALRQPLHVSCAVVNVPFAKGVMTSDRRIALQSDLFDAQMNGTADFGKNVLDLTVKVAPKKDNAVSAFLSEILITGTPGKPVARLNADAGLQKALTYGLALLQGGASAAKQAVQDKMLTDVCQTALRPR